MNSSNEWQVDSSLVEEPNLLLRCKETIQELQRQLVHINRSKEIKEQECQTLKNILSEKDKRIEQLQSRTINLTLTKQTESVSPISKIGYVNIENQRLNRYVGDLREDVQRLQEQNRRLSSLNEMLINDKQFCTELVRDKDNQLKGLRQEKHDLQSKVEEYRMGIRGVQELYEKELLCLRTQLDQKQRQVYCDEYNFDSAWLTDKGRRDRPISKSQIRKNQHSRLTSEYTGCFRDKTNRLELKDNQSQSGTLTRAGSASYLPRSHFSLQRNITDLYGIVHNGRS